MNIRSMLSLLLVLTLTACGSQPEPEPEPETPTTDHDSAQTDVEYDVTTAEQTYTDSCIRCHGGDLSGRSGPSLIDNNFTPEEIKEILVNGQGAMPPIDLQDEEAENLANWLSTQ